MIFRSKIAVRLFILAVCIVCITGMVPRAGFADDVSKRVALAEKLVDLRPVAVEVNAVVEQLAALAAPEAQAELRDGLNGILKPEALRQAAIDAYVEIYSLEELEAMADFYAKPAGRSALSKTGDFNQKIVAEITRLMDKAKIDGAL